MSDSTTLPRPPQVTLAGWITVVGSVFVVFSVFEVVAAGRSIETRERVADALDQQPLSGSGVTLEQALGFLHGMSLVAGACAVAAAILGGYVLQCSKSARLALTIIAPVLFLSGMVTGGFMSSMVAVAAVMLWTAPARDWFNGIAPRRPQVDVPPPPDRVSEPDQVAPRSNEPRAYVGFGGDQRAVPEDAAQGQSAVTPAPASETAFAPSGTAAPRPAPRPREVLQACLLTWVFSGVVLCGMLIAILAFAASPDMLQEVYESDDRFADADLDLDTLRAASISVAAVFSVWAIVATVLAVFTFLGHNWARITLIISAAVTAMLGLVMMIAAPMLALVSVAAILAIVMLTRARTNAWFLNRSRRNP